MENNQDNQMNIINGSGTLTTGNLAGISGGDFGITTTSTFCFPTYTRKLESVNFVQNNEGNFMEIIYKEIPNQQITYTVTWNVTPKTRMVKERYGVVDGKMQLIKTVVGTEEPGYYVPPTIEWEE